MIFEGKGKLGKGGNGMMIWWITAWEWQNDREKKRAGAGNAKRAIQGSAGSGLKTLGKKNFCFSFSFFSEPYVKNAS